MIEIDDNLEGKERRRQMDIKAIQYALSLHKSKLAAAKFLGLSVKGLDYKIKKHPELDEYKNHRPKFMQGWSEKKVEQYFSANKFYLDAQTRKYYDAWRSSRDSRSSEASTEHNRQDIRQDANI